MHGGYEEVLLKDFGVHSQIRNSTFVRTLRGETVTHTYIDTHSSLTPFLNPHPTPDCRRHLTIQERPHTQITR